MISFACFLPYPSELKRKKFEKDQIFDDDYESEGEGKRKAAVLVWFVFVLLMGSEGGKGWYL